MFASAANFLTPEELREHCADRQSEISHCTSTLQETRNNVLLLGERGVGKTFLIRLVEANLTAGNRGIIPVSVDMINAIHGLEFNPYAFGQSLLLIVIAQIWRTVFGRPYEALVSKTGIGEKDLGLGKPEKVLQSIHEKVRSSAIQVATHDTSLVGAAAVVKGERKEERHRTLELHGIMPYEFSEYARDIIDYVLYPKEYEKIVVLCDETNQFPIRVQKRAVEANIEIFRNGGVQFLFVMSIGVKDDPAITDLARAFHAFDEVVELKRFSSRTDTAELLSKYFSMERFPENASAIVHEAFAGHPRYSLEVCHSALIDPSLAPDDVVTERLLNQRIRETKEHHRYSLEQSQIVQENYLDYEETEGPRNSELDI
jgi:hypothetical protein